jgi:hypothetical protein
MSRLNLLFSKIALGAIILFLVSSSTVFAQVAYTLTGTLSLVSGTDPLGLNGHEATVTTTLNQLMEPSGTATTTTSSTNTYNGMTITMLGFSCSPSTPPVTVTLTDNVGAPDTIAMNNCAIAGVFEISGSVTIPDGAMITAVPSAIPLTSVTGSVSLNFESGTAVFNLTSASIVATGTPPPIVIPSLTAWTPTAPMGSTIPLSQNVTFTTVPSPAYAAVSFSTSVSNFFGGNWLSVSPAGANTESLITITANPIGLNTSPFSGTVILTYGPDYPTTTIPVTFTLTPDTPSVQSLSPITGTGVTQTFTMVYSDPNGLSDLSDVLVLFNTPLKLSSACAVVYVPRANQMYLYDDAGTGFSTGVTPGSSASVSNSQCALSGKGSSLSTSGNSLTLNAALTFSSTFVGSKNVYLDAVGKTHSSGWVKEGTWIPSSEGPPSVVSLSPTTGTGSTQTFTAIYSDPNGLADLNDVLVLFNASAQLSGSCTVIYIPETDQLFLYNDAGTRLSAGVTPGSAAQVSNSQCTLGGMGSSVSAWDDTLTVNVTLTFSGTFTGLKNAYLNAEGRTQSSGWVLEGAWIP